ncbi:unnamed protein product, partial [Mesorhabditis belari]|uniref:Potassium channel tetramerisation-type BTB domain-containing protein n=1 Tax=Mesorhabditis belari TaxID=2138241 RepID=A0AAF3FM65_9BILA
MSRPHRSQERSRPSPQTHHQHQNHQSQQLNTLNTHHSRISRDSRDLRDFRFETSELADPVSYTLHHASELLHLNVGGTRYTTLYETIARVQSTFFNHYCKIDARSGKVVRFNSHIIDDGTGAIFINRDGSLFAYILQYMRDGRQAVLPKDQGLLRQIQREAQYYGIESLRKLISDILNDLHNDHERSETLENIHAQVKQIAHSLAFSSFNNRI